MTVNGKKEKSAKLQINEYRRDLLTADKKLDYEGVCLLYDEQAPGGLSQLDPKHKTVLDLLDDLARSKEVSSRSFGY